MTFSFAKICVGVARQCGRRRPVALNSKERLVLTRPIVQRLEKSFVEKLGQGLPPVVPDCGGLLTEVIYKDG